MRRLSALARLLDTRFGIPGTRWRFGLDALVGLIPGIGDTATALVSAYIVFEARRLGVPKALLGRMVWNVVVDYVVGSIPVVGDVFDVAWQANRRNVALIERHFTKNDG